MMVIASFKDVLGDGEMVEVFTLPMKPANKTQFVQFETEKKDIEAISACFYFKPNFRFNLNYSMLLDIPDVLSIGIYKDSGSGWVIIGTENLIFDFVEPLFPRTWYSMCVQAGEGRREVWHENKTIFKKDSGIKFKLGLQVVYVLNSFFSVLLFFCLNDLKHVRVFI